MATCSSQPAKPQPSTRSTATQGRSCGVWGARRATSRWQKAPDSPSSMMPAASQTAISIFDNGTTVFENGVPEAVEESRGTALELDEQKMSAALVGEYTHPDKQYA